MTQTTEFKVKHTEISGLLEIDISLITDERGFFQEKFQKEKLVAAGFPESFMPVQQNVSYNKSLGTIRGIHAEPWDKYITVVSGKVFAAFVDLRKENFGKVVTLEIDSKKAIFLPEGVGNSYQSLEPDTYYQYLVNKHWKNWDQYVSLNVGDPDLAIQWPISLDKAILSDKDRKNLMLKDIKPFSNHYV
jgi:dTDP-4-dehydrorhamnose 3,5-epimerase